MKVFDQLIIVPLLLTVLPAKAVVTFTSADGALGVDSVSTDLFQTSLTSTNWPTNNNINNGTTGTFDEDSATNPANITAEFSTFTFNLDVTANPLGYTITSINSFSGWIDNRAGQSYTISFSKVATPLVFNQITPGGSGFNAVSVAASGKSLVTSVFDGTSSPLGTGIHSIRFDVGANGAGNVWREIDAIGVATIPEPGATFLGGLVLLGLLRRRR